MTTGINYLDEVWNTITGCSGKNCKIRETCWARAWVKKFPVIHDENVPLTPFNEVQFHPDRRDKPLHWRKARRIGVCFLGDWMDEQVKTEWIDQILEVIVSCPQHTFFSLTKQPKNLEEKIYKVTEENPMRELGGGDYLPNLYNGITITDQEDADTMIPQLLDIPGKHWISIEPMLGPIRIYPNYFSHHNTFGSRIDWVVVGCHNQPKKYPCKIEWIEDIVEQCQFAGVPIWVKQIPINNRVCHDINQFPEALKVREYEN